MVAPLMIDPSDLFNVVDSRITRGHRFKISYVRYNLDCRKRSFALRCINTWNALPDSVVSLDSLEHFKKAIHVCLGNKLFEYYD